jgi:hypothetical protein
VIQSDDLLVSIDPVANRAEQIVVPTSGPAIGAYKVPSPNFPEQPIWQRRSDPRSVAIVRRTRVVDRPHLRRCRHSCKPDD